MINALVDRGADISAVVGTTGVSVFDDALQLFFSYGSYIITRRGKKNLALFSTRYLEVKLWSILSSLDVLYQRQ